MPSLSRAATWLVAAPVVLYASAIMLGLNPFVQRHILYAHKFYQWWQDSDQPQQWGFARNQITSFHLDTEDGESIHAWHILPLPVYRQHEAVLQVQPTGHCDNVVESAAFRILRDDPTSKLIVYLHGNAGHLPSLVRSSSFHMYTATSNYHVLAIDYRGFGTSSGVPSEDGLILDASAALRFALKQAGLTPDRIVVLGHSLGSGVAAGAVERYARVHSVDFAGVVIVAGFSSLSNMLAGYAIGGWVPILRPLRSYPRVLRFVYGFILDRWETAQRLQNIVRIVQRSNADAKADGSPFRRHFRLSLIHAADDHDIPCDEDDKIFAAAVEPLLQLGPELADEATTLDAVRTQKEEHTQHLGHNAFLTEWRDGDVIIRQERFPYGGHNNMVIYSPVLLEIMKAFEQAEQQSQ